MKLAKLLGAGKSFFSGHGLVSYRENKHVYLPKFNSEKNPFMPKPKEAAADAGVSKPVMTSVTPAVPVMATVAAKTQKISTPAVPVATPAPANPKPVRKAGWADKLNPFRAPEPASLPLVNAVQPELSLDAVKVLHNDLSDADVEVVPVKSRPAGPVKAAAAHPMDFVSEPVLRTI